ncbi:hypothetical protein TCAL_06906 [Tigriopus californicus]|uniref:Ig-like domain-containing protein n=1 Tax=Tigriopus californicus TaxID=6832 RepID=A0A553PL59_TIGCA|nr:uncharacterized protein LOC131890655 [Tigriopus californicus]TRY78427.1 hypothetical protein TCAL_06906 [Tigriopus californicus]|eukprot:TCALIF_06906-PA protein Name:"Protein of unknown function" AED:0.00 eAED:0.00 QI:72/1/1/1/1/1/2/81/477
MTEFFIRTIKIKTTGMKVWAFLLLVQGIAGFEIEISQDPVVKSGEEVQIMCTTERRDDIENCSWFGPETRTEYTPDHSDRSIEVQVRRDLCTLTIRKAGKRDEGAWLCRITNTDNEEAKKFAYLNVERIPGKVEILLKAEKTLVTAKEGERLEVICPFTARFTDPRSTPTCVWINPLGERFNLADNRGVVAEYEDLGILSAGELDQGECGILLTSINQDHYGHWTCEVLNGREDGRPGTEIVARDIIFTEPEREDFQEDKEHEGFTETNSDRLLTGRQDGDRDVVVYVDIDIPDDIEVQSLYWITQRYVTIPEGETVCPERDNECYVSSERYQLEGTKYEMKLIIDRLAQADLDDPLVLIMDYKDKDGVDRVEVLTVPGSGSNQGENEGYTDDEIDEESDEDRENIGEGEEDPEHVDEHVCETSCIINKERVERGDSNVLSDLCVEIFCDGNGAITAIPLEGCKPKTDIKTEAFERK